MAIGDVLWPQEISMATREFLRDPGDILGGSWGEYKQRASPNILLSVRCRSRRASTTSCTYNNSGIYVTRM